MPKILASHGNIGACLKYWRMLKILASHENLGGYTKYRRLVKYRRTIGSWRALKSPRLAKISAESLALTIWARRSLQLLTSSWSGWRALVQILVDVLPLRHVDPKSDHSSSRSAFMGGVSPLLYRLVVPARHAKIHVGVQILGSRANFRQFLGKLKNSILASKCPITEPKIRT